MNNDYIKFLNKKDGYDINDLIFRKTLKDIKKEIIDRKELIEEANKIDNNHWKKKINVEKLVNVVENLLSIGQEHNKSEKLIISYNGNPYLTLSICIQAISKNKVILLETSEFMYGVNSIIFRIINDVLKYNNINNKIMYINELEKSEIEKIENIKVKIIGAYNNVFKYKNCNYEFKSYNNYFLISDDSEDIAELEHSIYEYAVNNCFEMEVLEPDEQEENIAIINMEKDFIVILLTMSDETKEKYINEIVGNKLYINSNPFEKEELQIYNLL